MATQDDSSSGAKWLTAPAPREQPGEPAAFDLSVSDWLPFEATSLTPGLLIALAILGAVLAILRLRAQNRRSAPPAVRDSALPSTQFTIRLPPPVSKIAPSPCRWVKDHFRHDAAMTRWVCQDCDADAFTQSGPPLICHRADRKLTGSRL